MPYDPLGDTAPLNTCFLRPSRDDDQTGSAIECDVDIPDSEKVVVAHGGVLQLLCKAADKQSSETGESKNVSR